MTSRFIPASAKKPFWMPIYQGQPTALAAPIMPVEMVSVALADGAPTASTQHSVAMICVSRDETMTVPREFLRSRRSARHQKIAGEHLHHFVVLIERRVLHPDHAAVGF